MLETRDIDWERAITESAAEGLGFDPATLIRFSEERASVGAAVYGDVGFLDRPMSQEALDEIADCRNYLTWWVQKIALRGDGLDDGTAGELLASLTAAQTAVIQLWEAVRTAKRLSDEVEL